jgi:hypothetical protein
VATGRRIRVANFDSGFSLRIFLTTGKLNKMLVSRPLTGFAQAALKGRYVSLLLEVVTSISSAKQPIRQFASASPTAAFAGQKGSNVSFFRLHSLYYRPYFAFQGKYTVTLIPGDGLCCVPVSKNAALTRLRRNWTRN